MKITLFLASFLISASMAHAAQLKATHGTFTHWQVDEVSNHDVFDTDACVAGTPSIEKPEGPNAPAPAPSRLEVYVQKHATLGRATEPTIVVQIKNLGGGTRLQITAPATRGAPQAPRFYLLPVSQNQFNNEGAFIAKVGDRDALIQFLRKTYALDVRLLDSRGAVIRAVDFSASGFSRAFDKLRAACSVPAIQEP